MTWEAVPISEQRKTFLYRINKEKGLKYHSMGRNEEISFGGNLIFGKLVEGASSHSISLITNDNDIFLPFCSEDRVTKAEKKRDPDFPYYTRHMTLIGINQYILNRIQHHFGYKNYDAPYFTITSTNEDIEKYFDIIADAHFANEQIIVDRYKNDIPPAQHKCTAFIYICPETGKEFIQKNPYL